MQMGNADDSMYIIQSRRVQKKSKNSKNSLVFDVNSDPFSRKRKTNFKLDYNEIDAELFMPDSTIMR
jgi:hypothetical protein